MPWPTKILIGSSPQRKANLQSRRRSIRLQRSRPQERPGQEYSRSVAIAGAQSWLVQPLYQSEGKKEKLPEAPTTPRLLDNCSHARESFLNRQSAHA